MYDFIRAQVEMCKRTNAEKFVAKFEMPDCYLTIEIKVKTQ